MTIVLAALAAGLSGWPTNLPLSLGIVLCALWLESYSVPITATYVFSPATPLYLAVGILPDVGGKLLVSLLLLDLMRRHSVSPAVTLAGHLAVVAPSAATTWIWHAGYPQARYLVLLVAPTLYLLIRLGVDGFSRLPEEAEERAVWLRLQLKIRPLEVALAAMGSALAGAASYSSPLLLAGLPILASTYLAAENVLLKANDKAVEQALRALKEARASVNDARQKLLEAEREKQLLEGFAAHLASQPELGSTARTLVATVGQLMPCDNVAVFFGSPPEPYSYRVSEEHREALQGAALTGIREPLVDRASRERKAMSNRSGAASEPQGESLFGQDRCALAVPLGTAGVLYVGRQSASTPFAKSEKDRLLWLTAKAEVALEAAYGVHKREREARMQKQKVEVLQKQVAWLANLVRGAEEMASTLDVDDLAVKLSTVLPSIVVHDAGSLWLGSSEKLAWGGGVPVGAELLGAASQAARPIGIEDLETSRFKSNAGHGSLVVAPMLAEEQQVGYIALASADKRAFSSEAVDLLFLLASQAAVAFTKARLHQQVVRAQRDLQESQAQLVQSSKMTAMGQMAAGVAHELNSPLGAIALLIDEASYLFAQDPGEAQKMLDQAQEAVDKSREIVNRLMTYSRPASKDRETLELAGVVNDTLNFLGMQIKDHGVSVERQLAEPSPVLGERQPLQQVITNLVLNACQAMDGLPVERKVLKVQLGRSGDSVVLSVTDRGCGIAEENLARIFDPFFTTKPVGRGTGLGLWASHQIVKEHAGKLEVQSKPQQGTRFQLLLPAASGTA